MFFATDLCGATFCTTSGLLTATGAETVWDTTVDINYCIGGKAYVLSATADGETPTTDAVTGAAFSTLTGTATGGQVSVFVWCLDAAGAAKVVQGEVITVGADGGVVSAPEFPTIPDTLCPFAYQILGKYGVAATCAFGTTNWSSYTSNTITNLLAMPARPQQA